LRLSRFIGDGRPAPALAAFTLVVKGLTQSLQFVDQGGALEAHPIAAALTVPALRGAIHARIIVGGTHG
jgi:hypothetical protein